VTPSNPLEYYYYYYLYCYNNVIYISYYNIFFNIYIVFFVFGTSDRKIYILPKAIMVSEVRV